MKWAEKMTSDDDGNEKPVTFPNKMKTKRQR
jgi:hypothetical protein